MGLFSRKDWIVIAILFERKDLFQVNGNRAKGKQADKVLEGVQKHPRSIYWATFDPKGTFLEGGPASGANQVSEKTITRLSKELMSLASVRSVLSFLEKGDQEKIAKPLPWIVGE